MMGIISLCTLFCPEFAYYIPLFIIGFAQIRYFTLKSLLGAFIGFATPFWILIGIGIMPFSGLSALIPDFTFHIPETLPFNDPQFWTIVLTALLGLFSGTATLYTTFNEKRQTRAYNGFINLLSVYSAILLIIDYRNYTLYLPVLNIHSLGDFSIWNGERSAPLSQVTERIETTWEFPQVRTYNRQLSMAAMCGVKPGHTMAEVHGEIRKEIENIQLPEGYTFFWDAQYKDQGEAMQAIAKYFPLAFLALVVILVGLFGNFREPVIILCVLPLSLIGIAVGMLLTGFDFGFFPIAGWLGLLGMIIKNVIVLIDEINVQHRSGIDLYTSIVEATVSRTRPVLMAATTTIFGMVPLLFDVAFGGMAATIIFGLTFATGLTLFVTPALYSMFYKVKGK